MNISGKHIVITGGASGLGLEMVRQLYAQNEISIIARPSARLAEFRKDFASVAVYEADLADIGTVEDAADQIIRDGKPIDVLINNAAVQYTPAFLDDDFCYETIQREITVNFTSVCILVHLLLPAMLHSKPASIVNLNSGLALVPKTGSAVYCATKGALNIFSQSLAHQLENTNISVQQVFLPLVDTAMTKGRGGRKLTAERAVEEILRGVGQGKTVIDVGKVKYLRVLQRVLPGLAQRIMKRG